MIPYFEKQLVRSDQQRDRFMLTFDITPYICVIWHKDWKHELSVINNSDYCDFEFVLMWVEHSEAASLTVVEGW